MDEPRTEPTSERMSEPSQDLTRRRVVLGGLVLLQCALLYWPNAASNPHDLPLDKLVHATIFGVVAWAGVRAGVPVGWLVGLLLTQAVLSEVVQDRLLPHRSGDPWDAVADTIGTFVGLFVARSASRPAMMRAMWGSGR
jgi:hypothetical protein